jgi:hypothetical protein
MALLQPHQKQLRIFEAIFAILRFLIGSSSFLRRANSMAAAIEIAFASPIPLNFCS